MNTPDSIEAGNSSLLTIRQASKLLNIHSDTLRRWERQGKIRSFRIGTRGDRRYRSEELLSYLQSHTTVSQTKSSTEETINNQKGIREALLKSHWVYFDVGYTIMSLFPSRGDVYADLAYSYGYNLDPLRIQQNFDNLEAEWDQEKILTQPLTHASSETVAIHYAQFNAEVLILTGIPRQDYVTAVAIGKSIFNAVFSNDTLWRVFTDVVSFLELLKKQGKKLAIVENWDGRLPGFIAKWKLHSYFDLILSGGDLKLRKPDQRLFQIALEKTGADPQFVIHIGDRYVDDVLGPRQVGITPILFDYRRLYIDRECLKTYSYKELIDLISLKSEERIS